MGAPAPGGGLSGTKYAPILRFVRTVYLHLQKKKERERKNQIFQIKYAVRRIRRIVRRPMRAGDAMTPSGVGERPEAAEAPGSAAVETAASSGEEAAIRRGDTAQSSGPVQLPPDRLWTVHQAAAFLGRSTSWVYKAAERGELPRAKGMGWGLRFVPADLMAYARGELPAAPVVPLRRGGGA